MSEEKQLKFRFAQPKVLYLHGVEPHDHHMEGIEKCVGVDQIRAIRFGSPLISSSINLTLGLLWLAMICSLIPLGISKPGVSFMALGVIGVIVVGMTLFFLSAKARFALEVFEARRRAEKMFMTFRPTIIIASEDGAAVALLMRTPKVPLLLFTPAQGRAARRLFMSLNRFSLRDWPMATICHGKHDRHIPIQDSEQLQLTALHPHLCRLYEFECGDSSLRHWLDDENYERCVMYTYKEGWIQAFQITPADVQRMTNNNCHIDFTVLSRTDILQFAHLALVRQPLSGYKVTQSQDYQIPILEQDQSASKQQLISLDETRFRDTDLLGLEEHHVKSKLSPSPRNSTSGEHTVRSKGLLAAKGSTAERVGGKRMSPTARSPSASKSIDRQLP